MRFCFTFTPRFSSAVKAAFLDRDGVINVDYAYVHRRENFHFIPGALEGAAELVRKGYQPVIVTNQSGIGRGKYSIEDFRELSFWLAGVFERHNAPLSAVYFCPHHPTHAFAPYLKDCDCRGPNPGMLFQAAQDLNIDLTQSVLIGDKPSDIQAAKAAGLSEAVLVQSDGTKPLTECTVPHLQAKDLLAAAKLL